MSRLPFCITRFLRFFVLLLAVLAMVEQAPSAVHLCDAPAFIVGGSAVWIGRLKSYDCSPSKFNANSSLVS